MAKESSVAPKERVNIVYKTQVGNAQEEVELPLKILMMGDYTGRKDDEPVEKRAPINIDKSNFNEVMAKQELAVTIAVPDKLSSGKEPTDLNTSLKFQTIKDFEPESIAGQVPELKKLLELREALTALKFPIQLPSFRKKIQSLLGDTEERKKLMAELGLGDETEKK
jgi:type VI secretion system protein ImpB